MPVSPEQADAALSQPNEPTQRLFDEIDRQLLDRQSAAVWHPSRVYYDYNLAAVRQAYEALGWEVKYQHQDGGVRDTDEGIFISKRR